MKNLVEFLNESISKSRAEDLEANFYDWLDMNSDDDWTADDLKEFAYDNVADFADDYGLFDKELDELTHPKNDKVSSFNNWIKFIIKDWDLK